MTIGPIFFNHPCPLATTRWSQQKHKKAPPMNKFFFPGLLSRNYALILNIYQLGLPLSFILCPAKVLFYQYTTFYFTLSKGYLHLSKISDLDPDVMAGSVFFVGLIHFFLRFRSGSGPFLFRIRKAAFKY